MSGLYEPIGQAICFALYRGIEDLDRVRIILVREEGTFRVQYETRRLYLLADRRRVDTVKRLGVARAVPAAAAWSMMT